MSNQDTDFELSRIEKIIRFLSLSLLIGTIFLNLFFQQAGNILLLPYSVFIYSCIYLQDYAGKKLGRFFKLIRFFLAILCLLMMSMHFMWIYFELSLNIQFIKVAGTQSLNHPIANFLSRWQLIFFFITFLTLPVMSMSVTTGDDVE